MQNTNLKKQISAFPDSSGVYLMMGNNNQIIYVGKASSLKKRVASYFTKAHNAKTQVLVSKIIKIDYVQTDSILEATLLEAKLIKKHLPKYNIQLKDDKTFIYIAITNNDFPKVLTVREKGMNKKQYKYIFGPFTSDKIAKEVLKTIRKIFIFSNCTPGKIDSKPCFYYHLGQCPGICTGEITKQQYKKTIRNIVLFMQGRKKRVVQNLKKEMMLLSKQKQFEKAAKLRNQLFYLDHIQDWNLLEKEKLISTPFKRIEGYDISNISGKFAVGSMVVFTNGKVDKAEYRKFKIKTVVGASDTVMLKEVLKRRMQHSEWAMPNLILIDGGMAQVNAVLDVLKKTTCKRVPVIGIAKGAKRKNNRLVFKTDSSAVFKKSINNIKPLLVQIRDEAHRFAVKYHRKLRALKFSVYKN